MDELHALKRAKAGHQDGFAWLFQHYRGPLYRFLRRHRELDADSANDVLQNVFIRAFRAITSLDDDRRFPAWILRIARREALRALSARRGEPLSEAELERASKLEEEQAAAIEYERLMARIHEVAPSIEPPAIRDTALRYYLGEPCTTKVLAEELGVPHATVRKRLILFREKLRTRLLEEEGFST